MDWILGLAIAAVGAILFSQAFALIAVTARLVKMRLQEPVTSLVPRACAGDYRAILDAAKETLERAGFRYTETRSTKPLAVADSDRLSYYDAYYHPEYDVHAQVYAASAPTAQRVFDVYLWDYFIDGTALMTVNGMAHSLIAYPSTITVTDACAPDFEGQLAAHLKVREKYSTQRIDPADAFANSCTLASRFLPELESEGCAYRDGESSGAPLYRLRLGAALKTAWRMRQGALRANAIKKEKGGAAAGKDLPQIAPEVSMAAERIAFVRALETLRSLHAPRWFRWSVLAVSAACFVALGAWWWGMATALAIGAVIVVHEAGHWGVMKLARFRDVHVFFVPGVGGATSGEKHEAHPLTHLAVFLAGPVPGLVFAIAALTWMTFGADEQSVANGVLGAAAIAAFVVNIFNLLPVMPLDGGRIVDLFVLGRLPWLRFVFASASGILLLWSGMRTDDNVMRMLGILFLFATPHQYRIAKVSSALQRSRVGESVDANDFSGNASKLYDVFAQPAYRKWNYRTKIALGHALLPRFLGRVPNIKETALGMTIYLASVALPIVAVGYMAASNPGKMAGRVIGGLLYAADGSKTAETGAAKKPEENPFVTLRREREARLAAVADSAQRLQALDEAIQDASSAEDLDDELRLARLFYQESARLAPPARERAHAARLLASAVRYSGDGPKSAAEVDRLLTEAETILRTRRARKEDKDDAMELAEVLQIRVDEGDAKNPVPTQLVIIGLYSTYPDVAGIKLPGARRMLAMQLDRAGQTDAAEEALRKAEEDYRRLDGGEASYGLTSALFERAWFLLAHQRPEEASQLVGPCAAHITCASDTDSFYRREAHLIKAMAARSRGDWSEVKAQASAAWELEQVKTGSKVWDFMFANFLGQPKHDLRATLLLIDAARATGRDREADTLVDEVRKTYKAFPRGGQDCRFKGRDASWRTVLNKALGEIEARELKCT